MEPLTKNDYTNRYVDASTQWLPRAQRGDHAAELRASIRDQIEVRIELGDEPAAAEVAVLNGMGDPAVLAAGYADRPLQLLGPRWYPVYSRILRIVLWSTLPFVALGVIIAMVLEGRSWWGVVGPTLGITFTAGTWIFTIMTIVFVRLERGGAPLGPWTVDQLPIGDPNEGLPAGRVEKVVGVVAVLLAIAALVFVTVPWSVPGEGTMSVLNPALWPWSLVVGLVLILVGSVVSFLARTAGRWSLSSALASAVIAIVWAGLVVGLTLAGMLFDPAFVALLDLDRDAERVIGTCLVVGTIGLAAWSVYNTFRQALR